ncbi:phage tail length tape measure family protein [Colwellia sp. E150_009]
MSTVVGNLVTKMSVDSASFQKEIGKAEKLNQKYRKAANDADGASKKLSNSFKVAANSAAIFNGPLGAVSGRLSSVGSGLSAIGAAGLIAGAAITSLTVITSKSLAVFTEYEQGQLKTEALLKSTGFSAGLTAEHIENLSRKVALNTLASVEGVRSASQVLLTFKSIQGQTFDKTIELSQDLASVMGTDIKAAALQLGKALEDPITGLNALKRSGVSFTQSQKELIREMQDSGRVADAQGYILETLEKQVGGAGSAEAGGLAGAVDTLGQNWREMLNEMAKSSSSGSAATTFISTLANGIKAITPDEPKIKLRALHNELIELEATWNELNDSKWVVFKDERMANLQLSMHSVRTEIQAIQDAKVESIKKEGKAQKLADEQNAIKKQNEQAETLRKQEVAGSKTLATMARQFADEEELINQKWEQQDAKISSMVLSELEIRRAGFESIEQLKNYYRDANDAAFNAEFAKIEERNQKEIDAAIAKEKKIQEAKAATKKSDEDRAKWEDYLRKNQQAAAGSQIVADLQMASSKSKKMGKIAKAAAISQATIKTYDSATGAYASLSSIPYVGPALGAAAAAAAIAAGMANVSAIRSQSIAGFEGGGYIPDGPRIGGVDGRGGKYAVLHPDESIYDHKQGQGISQGGVTVNLNITATDTGGFDTWYRSNRNMIIADVSDAVRSPA